MSLQTTVKMPTDWQLHQEEMEGDKSGDKPLLGGVFLEVAHRLPWLHSAAGTSWRPGAGQAEETRERQRNSAEAVERTFALLPLAHEKKERCAFSQSVVYFCGLSFFLWRRVKARTEQVGQTTDLYEG